MSRSIFPLTTLCLALVLSTACGSSDPAQPVAPKPSQHPGDAPTTDVMTTWALADYLPVAEIRSEISGLHFDTTEGQELFISGWTQYRVDKEGEGFRWTRSPSAVLEIPRLKPQDISITLEVDRPRSTESRPPQSLQLNWGAEPIKTVAIEPGQQISPQPGSCSGIKISLQQCLPIARGPRLLF